MVADRAAGEWGITIAVLAATGAAFVALTVAATKPVRQARARLVRTSHQGADEAQSRSRSGLVTFAITGPLALAASVLVGALACEAFSSGSFYWLSGRFAEPTLAEFALREAQYFPAYLATMAFWIAATAVGHVSVVTLRGHDTIAGDSAA